MSTDKSSSSYSSSSSSVAGEAVTAETAAAVTRFFKNVGVSGTIPPEFDRKNFFSDLVGGLLKVDIMERGRVSCLLRVKPAATNFFGGLHGGVVASVAEALSIACARTVVTEGKELFLGELSISYLSATPRNAELQVDATITRSGRNLTVVAAEFRVKGSGTEFRVKGSGNLTYTSRATFYNMPISSL